jgi:hypothetical protein
LVDTSLTGGAALDALGDLGHWPAAGASQAEKNKYARDALEVIIGKWGRIDNNFVLLNQELNTQGASEAVII